MERKNYHGIDVQNIALICHEANKAYCRVHGDPSQPSWDDAPEWQKESAINGVKFHLENPGAGPSGSHENWLAEKLKAGWKYGPEKNPDKKEHPCCVPYADLPEYQQGKDYLFTAIVEILKGS